VTDAPDRRGSGELSDRIVDAIRAGGEWHSVRDVHSVLEGERRIAYTTVLTVMQRLAQRGVLDHERIGRAGRYRISATVDPTRARSLIDQAVNRFGSVAIAQFVERTREDPELLAELRRQLDMEVDSDEC